MALCNPTPLVPRVTLRNQLPPCHVINPIRKNNNTEDDRKKVVGINLECLLGNFASSVPFFYEFVFLDVHGVGEGAVAHVSPMHRKSVQKGR